MMTSKAIFWLLDTALGFVLFFVIWGSLIKPWIQDRIRRRLQPYLPLIFERIDSEMGDRLQTLNKGQMTRWMGGIVNEATGGLFVGFEETTKAVDVVDELYSPLAKTSRNQNSSES